MLKQIRQAGFKGRVIQIGGPASDEIIEIAGPAAEGFLSYDMFDWDTPAGQKLRPIYEKKYGKGIINAVHAGLLSHRRSCWWTPSSARTPPTPPRCATRSRP